MQKDQAEWHIYEENIRCLVTIQIRRKTKIGTVLNIHVGHHEDRYSNEIQVRTVSVRGVT